MQRSGILLIAPALLFAPSLPAHHSDAGYDRESVVAFEGTVTRYTWRNPHVMLEVRTTDELGEQVTWSLETGSTPILTRSGWLPEALKIGDIVVVRANPERSRERNEAILISLEKADGTVLAQQDFLAETEAVASSLDGIWKGRPAEDTDFKQRLVTIAPTDAGRAAQQQYNHSQDNPLLECIPFPTPRLVDSSSYIFEIETLDDRVNIYSEYLDAHRVVYTDGRGHPEDGERTVMGHSIGHWEDDVLVVDTRLFADHPTPNRNGIPSGVQKHVVERYRLSDDRTRLLIDVFMEDPEYLAETFEGSVALYYVPGLKRFDYNCRSD